jgi:hydrogenase expression/formation protein HypE
MSNNYQPNCPVPKNDYDSILLAHGGGGRLSQKLIADIILPMFGNDYLNELHDGAIFDLNGSRFAFSTDSYVVSPIFFPGGNIGELAINGTVNDISMCGAKPLFISVGFIIEEGLPIEDFRKIVSSMSDAAAKAEVKIVTGDTKIVERGKCDKIFINTSGIGLVRNNINISPKNIQVNDAIILSGTIGGHGMAIMSVREGFDFESPIISDTAPLNDLVNEMLNVSHNIHVMRDPTRGGLASILNEICQSANLGIEIDETKIPVSEEVKAACEILGFDPLYVACEGRLVAFVSTDDSDKVLQTMRKHSLGINAEIIGRVTENNPGLVVMRTSVRSNRIIDMMSGEQLPRIC